MPSANSEPSSVTLPFTASVAVALCRPTVTNECCHCTVTAVDGPGGSMNTSGAAVAAADVDVLPARVTCRQPTQSVVGGLRATVATAAVGSTDTAGPSTIQDARPAPSTAMTRTHTGPLLAGTAAMADDDTASLRVVCVPMDCHASASQLPGVDCRPTHAS